MAQFNSYILIFHILAGSVALFSGPIAMISKKGGVLHKKAGMIYLYAMSVIFLTAIMMSLYKWIPFLLMLAVFSYYMVVSGYRWLSLKKLGFGQKPAVFDWAALIITALFSLSFLVWGGLLIYQGSTSAFAYLAIGFGILGLLITRINLLLFITNTDNKTWLYKHIVGMVGGYIGTTTAFSATVFSFLPGALAWIWPSAIGVPLIFYWVAIYRKKYSKKIKSSEVIQVSK